MQGTSRVATASELPAPGAAIPTSDLLYVGVGASAGGLDALKTLLGALPGQPGMVFLVVQHLAPDHESLLAELLQPHTAMAVLEAEDGTAIEPDMVYIIQPDTALGVTDGHLAVSARGPGLPRPVDHLFDSLATSHGSHSVAVVLSGAGTDGSEGLRRVRAAGGMTIAQIPEQAGQPGMPHSAVQTGMVDLVLSIDDIPEALARFQQIAGTPLSSSRPVDADAADEVPPTVEELTEDDPRLETLAAILAVRNAIDLTAYKTGTVRRRVMRRMVLGDVATVETYLDRLRMDPGEQQALTRDLLIGATDFFRDPEAYEILAREVIRPLVERRTAGSTLRVWVAGCATGEEAYSIAIEFCEAMAEADIEFHLQVFATDVDADAIEVARSGQYPVGIADHIDDARLHTWFDAMPGGGWRVRSSLRDRVSFAVHDLTRDPPFSNMDLVSCRNVLIYLRPPNQRRVLEGLHFALKSDGHLFLGSSESTGARRELFTTVSKPWRLYRRSAGTQRTMPRVVPRVRDKRGLSTRPVDWQEAAALRHHDVARKAILRTSVPPTVVVGADGSVLFMHGDLRPWLQFPQGDDPRLSLPALLEPWLHTRVRGVLHRARRNGRSVQGVARSADGESVKVIASPADELGDGALVVTFEPLVEVAPPSEAFPESEGAVVEELERQLQETREDLRSTVEELETSNEELRSANEESMSMNEELQSANEELEATTEELGSLNEELTTVNAQLRDKVVALERANDDLQNFFASTDVATVFLDRRLCIKRITPAAASLLQIARTDEGRYVGDIARELLQRDLVEEARRVLDQLDTIERELQTADGRWVRRRLSPYRTEDRRIDGVVVTWVDITELRDANRRLQLESNRLELAWEAVRGGIFEHADPPDDTTWYSDHWARVLGYRRDDLPEGAAMHAWAQEQVHPDDREARQEALESLFAGEVPTAELELRMQHRDDRWLWVREVWRTLERDDRGRATRLLGSVVDIDTTKRTEQQVRQSEARFREMVDGLPLLVWIHDPSGQQELVNERFWQYFGVEREGSSGDLWRELLHPDDRDAYVHDFLDAVRRGLPFHHVARVRRGDGEWRWIESFGRPGWTDEGPDHFLGASVDITDRRRAERRLRTSEERLRLARDAAQIGIYDYDPVSDRVQWDDRSHEVFGTSPPEATDYDSFLRRVHPEDRERVQRAVGAALDPGGDGVYRDEYRIVTPAGTERWIVATGQCTFEEGQPVRLVGTVQDITSRRLALAQLEDSRRRLLEADRRKDEFLAMLGHELRNPLAAVRSATEVLQRADDPAEAVSDVLGTLKRQVRQLSELVAGLLAISRITRGKLELRREHVDLVALVRDSLDDLRHQAEANHIEVVEELPDAPLSVFGDPIRLSQVVQNLLGNAFKFTEPGGRVDLRARQRSDGTAEVMVRDNGVGFDSELSGRLFEPFQQGDQDLARATGGLGLGLPLARGLVDLHGGELTAHSDGPGLGATFRFTLPLSACAADDDTVIEEIETAPLRILLVEDNVDTAEMMRQVLVLSGHEVRVAHDGEGALEIALDGVDLDVVVCDLGLPGMTGFDVARKLRAELDGDAPPMVALSGYARAEDRAQSLRSGFARHLTKPVDIDHLERILAEVTGAG